jgi:signal transduction histidine kinase/DNA-binding response OmpR family regulator
MNPDVIRVLLVEDSESDADLMRCALQEAGAGRFELTWVERLEEGLARLRREPYDALLLDLHLPDSSGPETFRRALSAAPGIALVVLTGSHDEALGITAIREGIERYLVKGEATGRQIARAIRFAIESKRTEEKIRRQNAVLAGMNRILTEALTTDSEEGLGRVCLRAALETTRSQFGFVGEINGDGLLDCIAISETGWKACGIEGQPRQLEPFEIRGIYGRVLTDGKAFFTNDPRRRPESVGLPEGHLPLNNFLGAPLVHGGKTIGMIAAANSAGGYGPEDVEALEALALGVVQVLMRKRAERAVRAGEERLRQAQKMESIGLLAAGVAHDFNNLLASIMGNASLLREEVTGKGLENVDAVIDASEKAADLTRQLLAYAGKGRFVIESHDLSHMVRDMTDLLRASIPRKVNVKLALAPDLPCVEADRGQLQQVIMNLALNGAEAIGADRTGVLSISAGMSHVSEADSISDEITGRSLPHGDYVWLEVADTGSGMDAETRKKIFEPFFTTKFLGRGLGLAAVAGIVQAHRGAIQLRTAPGEGAAFRVYLPAGGAVQVPRRQNGQPDLKGNATVLVVDDEAMVRTFTRAALERFGYRVITANDGREAVRIFEAKADAIGLVLLDLAMPELGGDEAIDAFKSIRPDLRVIVMSGYGESEVLKTFAGKGVSGFLQKPFTAARLAEEVRLVLKGVAKSH